VRVGDAIAVRVAVRVGVGVAVGDVVGVRVAVRVGDAVEVRVAVGVAVGVREGVGVGFATSTNTRASTVFPRWSYTVRRSVYSPFASKVVSHWVSSPRSAMTPMGALTGPHPTGLVPTPYSTK